MKAVVEMYHRWRRRVKLRGGQCKNCGAILRDDQRELCSEQCDVEYRAHRSW